MGGDALVFRNSARGGWSLVQFGVLPVAVGVVFTYVSGVRSDIVATATESGPGYNFTPLAVFGACGLVMIGLDLRLVLDRRPKLTVDAGGLTDHAARRHFAWPTLQEVDWRTTGRNNAGGKLILHVRGGADVSAHRIPISVLEGGPVHVGTAVKARWLDATAGRRGDAPPGPPAGDKVWVG